MGIGGLADVVHDAARGHPPPHSPRDPTLLFPPPLSPRGGRDHSPFPLATAPQRPPAHGAAGVYAEASRLFEAFERRKRAEAAAADDASSAAAVAAVAADAVSAKEGAMWAHAGYVDGSVGRVARQLLEPRDPQGWDARDPREVRETVDARGASRGGASPRAVAVARDASAGRPFGLPSPVRLLPHKMTFTTTGGGGGGGGSGGRFAGADGRPSKFGSLDAAADTDGSMYHQVRGTLMGGQPERAGGGVGLDAGSGQMGTRLPISAMSDILRGRGVPQVPLGY